MSNFDGYVFKVLKELNMAKGGIANQSGTTNQPQGNATGSTTPSVSPNPVTKVNPPKTTATNSPFSQGNTSNQPADPNELKNLFLSPETNLDDFVDTDPDNMNELYKGLTQLQGELSPAERTTLDNKLKNSKRFKTSYDTFINNFVPITR